MLVGFTNGEYKKNPKGHSIGGGQTSWLARSTDMGLTWTAWDPDGYVGDFGNTPKRQTLKNAIDFSHPQFAMSVFGYHSSTQDDDRSHFFYSDDAGTTWNGPYAFGTNDIRPWPELTTTTLGDRAELDESHGPSHRTMPWVDPQRLRREKISSLARRRLPSLKPLGERVGTFENRNTESWRIYKT